VCVCVCLGRGASSCCVHNEKHSGGSRKSVQTVVGEESATAGDLLVRWGLETTVSDQFRPSASLGERPFRGRISRGGSYSSASMCQENQGGSCRQWNVR
jgi:hypothetical protein